jgi:hypothetical protein
MNTLKFIAAEELLGDKDIYQQYRLRPILMVVLTINANAYNDVNMYKHDLYLTVAQAAKRYQTTKTNGEPAKADIDEIFNDMLSIMSTDND